MKRSFWTAWALLLILLSATVCEATDARSETHRRVENQMFDNNDKIYGASVRNGNMRFHNFSVELSGDPTRIENMDFNDLHDETSGPFTKMGCTILYNFNW